MAEIKQARIIVSGIVQGVGYRFFAERWASQLGIKGYVKNLWNGDVEVVAQGDESALNAFIEKLRKGPRAAVVSKVSIEYEPVSENFLDFTIRY